MKLLIGAVFLCVWVSELVVGSPECGWTVGTDESASVVCASLDSGSVDLLVGALNEASAATAGQQMNLEIRQSNIQDLPETILSGYALRSLVLYDNHLTQIPTAFLLHVDPRLGILDLTHNDIILVQQSDIASFPFADSLQTLLLADNRISQLEANSFAPLINLQTLRLQFNQITSLIDQTFANLPQLTELQLYANQIQQISVQAFDFLPNLRFLFLNGNDIGSLQNQTFSLEKFPALEKIFLGNNPFICDCSLQWLKEWLEAAHLEMANDATCVQPVFKPFEFVQFCNPIQQMAHKFENAFVEFVHGLIMNDERERNYRNERLRMNFQEQANSANFHY